MFLFSRASFVGMWCGQRDRKAGSVLIWAPPSLGGDACRGKRRNPIGFAEVWCWQRDTCESPEDGSGSISLQELRRACQRRCWDGDVDMFFRCLDVED